MIIVVYKVESGGTCLYPKVVHFKLPADKFINGLRLNDKLGFQNHHRIFGGYDIKITPGFTLGKLYDLGLYPAMLKRIENPDLSGTEGKEKVFGELIEFDNPAILKRVDYLEGFRCVNHPHNYYERRMVDVFVCDNTVKAWAYFLNMSKIKESDSELITSGIWSNYRN